LNAFVVKDVYVQIKTVFFINKFLFKFYLRKGQNIVEDEIEVSDETNYFC
jgi:hypothetical protein